MCICVRTSEVLICTLTSATSQAMASQYAWEVAFLEGGLFDQ